ncbi:MAG: glycosyltransferase family 2 protein [Candidatus Aenigmatarchaeota archaeon]
MVKQNISLVIPAHNEAGVINKTVSDFLENFPNAEIIVVDDGSSDNTYWVAKSVKNKRLKVVRLSERSGKGAAVAEGVKKAGKEIIGFVDADGAFDSSSLEKVLKNFGQYDAVIASKWKGRKFGEVEGSFAKKAFGRFWNAMTRIFLGLDFSDTQAGLKVFKAAAVKKACTCLIGKGFEFDAELLYKLKLAGFGIKEVYIAPKNVEKSRFSYLNIPSMLFNMVRMVVILKLSSKSGKQ